ncbi:glycosyltransferase family 4 protein [Planococcus sp. FY231025]|uniref:glycosyltransferase family 4 protein n=1 Tax=Planococcus sp. FY231025 TaxID=3455699 RepID=UPI003F90BF84
MHGGNFQEFYNRMPRMGKRRINKLLRESDKVIALGSKWEKILHHIEPEASIKVLMNAVPLPVLDESILKSNTFSILFLAVLHQEKGIFDLIEASVGAIKKAEEHQLQLVFDIAGDGPQLEQAKQLVNNHGISSSYCFHGWAGPEEKQKLMRKADLFVLPSYFEGLPMSVLEAISYGIPVVSTNVGSIDEAVKEGKNGYLIAPRDVEALEERLNRAIHHPALQEFRQASRSLAEAWFDEKEYFQQIEEMYEDLYREKAHRLEREIPKGVR